MIRRAAGTGHAKKKVLLESLPSGLDVRTHRRRQLVVYGTGFSNLVKAEMGTGMEKKHHVENICLKVLVTVTISSLSTIATLIIRKRVDSFVL